MLSRFRSPSNDTLIEEARLLVDPEWYVEQNPDIAGAGIDPFDHFSQQGLHEGRIPSPLFSDRWYLQHNPDVLEAGIQPCVHFLTTGGVEGRNPHPLFDARWYLETNPDVSELGMNPLLHFIQSGADEKRSPSPLFDTQWYTEQYPESTQNGANPLLYYLKLGAAQGHSPHPFFNPEFYTSHLQEDQAPDFNPLIHYIMAGAHSDANPHPLFNQKWYRENNPDVKELGINPLLHFIQSGANENRKPSPLFDTQWYTEQYPESIQDGTNPLFYYLNSGASQGHSPHPLFNPEFYTSHLQGNQPSGFNPVMHYIMAGPHSDANPHPLFNQKWYRKRCPELYESKHTPLEHYLIYGAQNGLNPHPLFFSWWYAEHFLDGNASGINPLQHFVQTGALHDTQPNPYFLTSWYQRTYKIDNQNNPLIDYLEQCEHTRDLFVKGHPIKETRNPNPWFETAWYFAEHSDIVSAEGDPLSHYIEAGISEERAPGPHFDPTWYRSTHNISEMTPLEHFLNIGAVEGYAPNSLWQKVRDQAFEGAPVEISYDTAGNPSIDPRQYKILHDSDLFDENWYRQEYLLPSNNNMDPIEHYLIFGAHLGYNPSTKFNSKAYRSINHDLRNAAINPLLHYIQHGRFEGRHATKETRDNEVTNFRFSKAEYGPITDILTYDSEISPPANLTESICLHLHLFHTEMADEFCEMINRLTIPFTLLISIQPEKDEADWTRYFVENITFAQSIIVKCCPNQGRDVQPWLVTFKDDIRKHDIFCHLHTKKSGYNKFQKSWRRYLAHTTFGTTTLVNQILTILADNQQVGLIFPAYFYILRNQPNYGKNFEQYERLYMLLYGDVPSDQCPDYPAGSFFWARTKMLEPLLDLDLNVEDFDEEDGQVDGTVAHALERILGSLSTYTGYENRCIAVDIPFDLTRYIHPARVDSLNSELLLPASFHASSDEKTSNQNPEKRRVAVYTAITGGYENLVKPLVIDPDIDYFLFTDTPEKFEPDWATVIQMPYVSHKSVRTARYAKTHPHFWFPDYDYAIWMDANVLPAASLHPMVQKLENTRYHAAFIQHPLRYNCMEEGQELIKFGLDDQNIIEAQLTRYGRIADIFQQELIETNFFICRPKLNITRDFMTLWWRELNSYSHRDQLSVGYALLKSGLEWKPLFDDNVSIRDHPDFFLLEHEMHNRSDFIEKVTARIDSQLQIQEVS